VVNTIFHEGELNRSLPVITIASHPAEAEPKPNSDKLLKIIICYLDDHSNCAQSKIVAFQRMQMAHYRFVWAIHPTYLKPDSKYQ
jgi:hypothetical protein